MKKLLAVFFVGIGMVGCSNEKTAYVDTTTLIQEYSEMKQVEADFTERSETMNRQFDSVAGQFQRDVQAYQEEMESMSQAERQETESRLMQTQQRLQQQQQQMSGALRQESDAVVDSLITKVKDFVADYGEANDYTYIFGSNESASIMYAEEGRDITQEVLEELNAAAPQVMED